MLDDTVNNRQRIVILIIGALFITGFFLSSGPVVGQATTDSVIDAQAIIQSRFMLWDAYEKTMDNRFDILLFSWSNFSNNYSININNQYFNGTFIYYKLFNYSYNNISIISVISVKIDNNTVLHANNIKLIKGVTQGTIAPYVEPYKISFLPFELTKFEWNLIFSGLVAVLISLPSAYIIVKYYRKHRGAQVL